MWTLFFICIIGLVSIAKLHFLSVEHLRLQEKYGKEKGTRIGDIYGLVSGWGFFLFWIGIWTSPQPRFVVPIFQNLSVLLPYVSLSIPLFHFVIFTLFIIPGVWLAINGVKETSLKTAETHRTERIVTRGVYSIVRHPQYLGGLFAHVGISFLLSAWYSLLFTPVIAALIFLVSRKEEEELSREFGDEYEDYKEKVPMLMPKCRFLRKSGISG